MMNDAIAAEDQEFERRLKAIEADPERLARFMQGAVDIAAEEGDESLVAIFDDSVVDVPFTCEHVATRHPNDCGIAAAASFCGVTYDEALAAAARGFSAEKGLALPGLRTLLSALWPSEAAETDHKRKVPLCGYGFGDDRPRLCLIREAGSKWGHFVVVECGFVLDSERALPEPVASYHRQDWLLIRSWVTQEEAGE